MNKISKFIPILATALFLPYQGLGADTFIGQSELRGNVFYWQRDRDRDTYDEQGKKVRLADQLDHVTLNTNLDFKSGKVSDLIYMEVGIFAAQDLNTGTNGGYSELNFFPNSKSAYDNDWSHGEDGAVDDGYSIYKSLISLETTYLKLRSGYFQPSVPSGLGVNWGFMPGTYLGSEASYSITSDTSFGLTYASKYKAPWYKDVYHFEDGLGNDAGYVSSVGIRSTVMGLDIDLASSRISNGPRKTSHIKIAKKIGTHTIKTQAYLTDDINQYEGTARQLAVLSSHDWGTYNLRLEATHTVAKHIKERANVGNYTYRLTEAWGGSNGAYDIWWDSRSDFNHDNELAIFTKVTRDCSDLIAKSLKLSLSAARGLGSKSASGKNFEEGAISFTASYNTELGTFGLHYTVLESNLEGNKEFSNAYEGEQDIRMTILMPFKIK